MKDRLRILTYVFAFVLAASLVSADQGVFKQNVKISLFQNGSNVQANATLSGANSSFNISNINTNETINQNLEFTFTEGQFQDFCGLENTSALVLFHDIINNQTGIVGSLSQQNGILSQSKLDLEKERGELQNKSDACAGNLTIMTDEFSIKKSALESCQREYQTTFTNLTSCMTERDEAVKSNGTLRIFAIGLPLIMAAYIARMKYMNWRKKRDKTFNVDNTRIDNYASQKRDWQEELDNMGRR